MQKKQNFESMHHQLFKGEAIVNLYQQYDINNEFFYKLPNLIQSDFKGSRKICYPLNTLDDESKEAAEVVIEKLQKFLQVWDVEYARTDKRYYFNLPPTSFQQKINDFELPKHFKAYEYNAVGNFSPLQVNQIYKTGTFEVPSKQFPIPYVWQISSWIIKGQQNIFNSYFDDLARSYNAYRTWKAYIKKEKDSIGRNISLRSSLYNIAIRPIVILSILIGFREMYSQVNEYEIENLIEFQRQIELQQKKNFNIELYIFLRKVYKSKNSEINLNKLQNYSDQFQKEIEGLKLQMQNQYDIQNEKKQLLDIEDEEKQEQKEHLQQQINQLGEDFLSKYKIYIDDNISIDAQIDQAIYIAQRQFWQDSSFNKNLVSQIISLGDCMRIYSYHYRLYKQQLSKSLNNFENQLKLKHKIKSRCYIFLQEQLQQYKKEVRKQLKEQFVKNLIEELNMQNLEEREIYTQFQQSKQNMKENLAKLKIEKKIENKVPSIQITVNKRLFPPYQVCKDNNGHYYLKRFQVYQVNSSQAGWKLKLMGVRYYVWTVNIIFWLFANAISGPIGIKALISTKAFHPDVEVNYQNGIVRESSYRVTPLIVYFSKVIEGMQNSRCNFESAPDTGLFGKSFYRMFNLIEVYIFRLILVGIIGVLIILPTIIISNFIISILMAITSWLWIPITIVIRILFNSLIYDTDVVRRVEKDIIWRSPNWFPLIINLVDFLLLGVLNALYCLFKLIIWHPILITFMIIFAFIRRYSRFLYDNITINIIKLLGRVPASQNNVAWKISGPGISRQYYYGIKLPQLFVLLQAQLEKRMLTIYENKLNSLIQSPSNQITQKIEKFFQIFGASFSFYDPAISYLKNQLDLQLKERRSLFPSIRHQVRFTQDELLQIMKQVKLFLKDQINKKNMQSFIWTSFNIRKGDYNGLAENIMSEVFGHQVLEPFEDVEMRFQLNVDQNFDFASKIDRVLDGEILFQIPNEFQIKPKEQEVFNYVRKNFLNYSEVLNSVYDSQGFEQNWSSLRNKSYRFFINHSLRI